MMMPFILLFIGLLLIFLEFFLPGGILATVAGLMLLASIVFFGLHFSFLWTLLYIVGIVMAVWALIQFMLRRLRSGKFKGIFLNSAQEGYLASEYAKELIGKRGEALTNLMPSGHITVEGKRYQAVVKAGYVEKGASIEVMGGEGAHLIVKRI